SVECVRLPQVVAPVGVGPPGRVGGERAPIVSHLVQVPVERVTAIGCRIPSHEASHVILLCAQPGSQFLSSGGCSYGQRVINTLVLPAAVMSVYFFRLIVPGRSTRDGRSGTLAWSGAVLDPPLPVLG